LPAAGDDESERALCERLGASEGTERIPKPKKQFNARVVQIDTLLALHARSERVTTLVDKRLDNLLLLVSP
jgi:hypothetical protein